MSILCNSIEEFIKSMMTEEDNSLELQRNELAQHFKCAPSHINYVLATRFTLERGYTVQSRRGGGGYIRIVRIDLNKDNQLYTILNDRVNDKISEREARQIIESLVSCKAISKREAALMMASICENALIAAGKSKDVVRARCLRRQLIELVRMQKECE